MPRNPNMKRLEILLTPQQYRALLNAAEAAGYISIQPDVDVGDIRVTGGSIAEYVRDLLDWHVPGFLDTEAVQRRGTYPRHKNNGA